MMLLLVILIKRVPTLTAFEKIVDSKNPYQLYAASSLAKVSPSVSRSFS